MKLTKIEIKKFKNLSTVAFELGSVNYLVGGNNAGKSSVLQAIHTAVSTAQTSAAKGWKIIPDNELRYCPTGKFPEIGHKTLLENVQTGNRSTITFYGETDEGEAVSYNVQLYAGRNAGAGIERTGSAALGGPICKQSPPFSIYVPGLAGIPHHEEFKSKGSVLRKIAGGEANIVLRNILLQIKKAGMLDNLIVRTREVFPEFRLEVNFDESSDQFISVKASTKNSGNVQPLDLMGTGILQAIQLFSYTLLFQPTLLLLDEPDSHLHPTNQICIINTLQSIAEDVGTKIILATHSRHLINSVPEDANVFWLDNGRVKSSGDLDKVKLLSELGALDQADELTKEVIILTEDNDKKYLKAVIKHMGLPSNKIGIVSYNGVGNSNVAIQIVKDLKIDSSKVIVHRDRDFLTKEEAKIWRQMVKDHGFNSYVANQDIEHIFAHPHHLAALTGLTSKQMVDFLDNIIEDSEDEFRKKFRTKRQEIIKKLYPDGGAPQTATLCPPDKPLDRKEHTLGKDLLPKIRQEAPNRLGIKLEPLKISTHSPEIAPALLKMIKGILDTA
ncbi:MAG: hypothetical protein DI586_10695 [Micavibrio aeruginosavorus]|uniref:AAA+ ATPase domain-containing protein n=1 Tax=Micavibrio aeruginosavorus TaxID=349221 RepID=A0A2W5H6Y5_9BACT|nr:MAG: hypothetical protein DI586_10695 [Micavibrio aeruginosavorus]